MNSDYILARWHNVRTALLETIDQFRNEELDFKPFPASWPVKQIMLHIAHEEYGEFAYGIAQTLPEFPPEYEEQDYPTLAAIKGLLDSVHSPTLDFIQQVSDAAWSEVIHAPWGATDRLIQMIDHPIEHEIHHRAELSLILGLLGRKGLDA